MSDVSDWETLSAENRSAFLGAAMKLQFTAYGARIHEDDSAMRVAFHEAVPEEYRAAAMQAACAAIYGTSGASKWNVRAPDAPEAVAA